MTAWTSSPASRSLTIASTTTCVPLNGAICPTLSTVRRARTSRTTSASPSPDPVLLATVLRMVMVIPAGTPAARSRSALNRELATNRVTRSGSTRPHVHR